LLPQRQNRTGDLESDFLVELAASRCDRLFTRLDLTLWDRPAAEILPDLERTARVR